MSEYAVEQVRSDDEARFVPEDDEGDLWGALCPHPVAEHEALREVAAYLRTPEVQEQLRGYRARREYPEEVVRALWGRGLGTLFGEATSALHLMTLNAITARGSGGSGLIQGVLGGGCPRVGCGSGGVH